MHLAMFMRIPPSTIVKSLWTFVFVSIIASDFSIASWRPLFDSHVRTGLQHSFEFKDVSTCPDERQVVSVR